MRTLRALFVIAGALVLLVPAAILAAEQTTEHNKPAHKTTHAASNNPRAESASARRAKLDDIAKTTLDKLFTSSPDAKALYDRAYGWAVFDNSKVSLGLSGAGGAGVASPRTGGQKTYMKMGSGGIGLGAGYQEYQVVFLFENQEHFNHFVDSGWTADASATAVAGKAGASAAGDFNNGIALFKLNEKGLAANADITGTKYWKDKKLNQ